MCGGSGPKGCKQPWDAPVLPPRRLTLVARADAPNLVAPRADEPNLLAPQRRMKLRDREPLKTYIEN